jgi:hypothetical protein
MIVEPGPQGHRPRRAADRDLADLPLDPGPGEVLEKAVHACLAHPVTSPAMVAGVKVQDEVVVVSGEQA